jgi:GTPase KRas protein
VKSDATKFVLGHFVEEYDPTIEDSYRKQLFLDNEAVLYDILDTAGQEEYSAMRAQYMRTCEGMILMYSVTDRESLKMMTHFQQQLLCVKETDYFPMLLVGNKAELDGERVISIQEGRDMAASFGCDFLETSAKTGKNVERIFHDIVREIRRHKYSGLALQSTSALELHNNQPLPESSSQALRRLRSTIFSRSLSLSSMKELFKPSIPNWNLDSEAERIRKQTLDCMLIQYARTNDKRRARKTLELVADKNVQPGVEGNALHAAAAVGHLDVVNVLIKGGIDLHARESRGNTALHLAALEGHAETVKLLLKRGARVNEKCGMYGTAVVAACTRGHTHVAQILIQKGADVSARGGPFGSSFHAAAMIGKADLVALLHGTGAEIDSRGVGNCTALQIAAFAGNLEVVKLLLDRNAAVDLEGGKYGRALKAASDRGHSDIYDLLIKKGASHTSLDEGEPHDFSSVNNLPQEFSSTTDIVDQVPREKNSLLMTSIIPHFSQGSRANVLFPGSSRKQEVANDTESASSTSSLAAQNFSTIRRTNQQVPRIALSDTAELQNALSGHSQYETADQVPFLLVENLGKGSSGIVDKVAFDRGTNHPAIYARKTFKNAGRPHVYRMIQDEIGLIKRLQHSHVVSIIATYSIGTKFAIIMTPVAEMDLKKFLTTSGCKGEMLRWFGCLAAGLAYLHSESIRHRDIKPANILIKGQHILYTDFGIAKDVSQDSTTSSTGSVEAKTYMYCAPEVAAEKPRGRSSDVFSLGCVFLEMTTVLLQSSILTLEALHNTITKDERIAYHAQPSIVLKFMFNLYILEDRPGRNLRLSLEYCFAMLHPDPHSRILAQDLVNIIQNVDSDQKSTASHIGECCALNSNSRRTQPHIFQIKPSYQILNDISAQHNTWEEVAQKVKYTIPKKSSDGDEG